MDVAIHKHIGDENKSHVTGYAMWSSVKHFKGLLDYLLDNNLEVTNRHGHVRTLTLDFCASRKLLITFHQLETVEWNLIPHLKVASEERALVKQLSPAPLKAADPDPELPVIDLTCYDELPLDCDGSPSYSPLSDHGQDP